MPRRIAIVLAAAALGLLAAAAGGWGATKPRAKPLANAKACVAGNKAWVRQLARRRGRALPALRGTVADGSEINQLSDAQEAAAVALVTRAATARNGMLRPLVGLNWEILDVQPLAGPAHRRTGIAPIWGAEVDIDLGGPLRLDAAVPATVAIPARPPRLRARFARWRSLGYVPYCARLRGSAISDLVVDVDMRSGARRIVDVFPGPDTDTPSLPRLPGQGVLPPGA